MDLGSSGGADTPASQVLSGCHHWTVRTRQMDLRSRSAGIAAALAARAGKPGLTASSSRFGLREAAAAIAATTGIGSVALSVFAGEVLGLGGSGSARAGRG